jgi:hypothetical protein
VKVAWGVWLAWAVAQTAWLLWPRREAPLYRTTTQSGYSTHASSAVRTGSRSSVRPASRVGITPAAAAATPVETENADIEPTPISMMAAALEPAPATAEPAPTHASGKQAVVKSLVGGSLEFLAALGFEEPQQKLEKPGDPRQSVYR